MNKSADPLITDNSRTVIYLCKFLLMSSFVTGINKVSLNQQAYHRHVRLNVFFNIIIKKVKASWNQEKSSLYNAFYKHFPLDSKIVWKSYAGTLQREQCNINCSDIASKHCIIILSLRIMARFVICGNKGWIIEKGSKTHKLMFDVSLNFLS